MMVKLGIFLVVVGVVFESSVNSYDGQTQAVLEKSGLTKFESSVNSYDGQTVCPS